MNLFNEASVAILSAFPTHAALKEAFRYATGEHLDSVVGPSGLRNQVFEMLRWAESRGSLSDFVLRMHEQNRDNSMLATLAAQLRGADNAPASTPKPETVMNNETQRIDSKHHDGIIPLIAQALVCTTPQAEAFLNELIESDTTYAKLAQLDRDTIADAARAAVPGVKAIRINDVVNLLKLLTSTVKVSRSGHLNITYSTLSGRWEILSNDTCTKDGSLFEPVKFPQPVIGWNDGKTYAAGTLHDDDGNPMTERGVNDYLMNVRGSELHPWIKDASRDYPALTLIDLMRHLRTSGKCRSSVEVYNFLISPQTTLASTQAQVAKIVRDAINTPGAGSQHRQTSDDGVAITDRFIRDTLIRLYPQTSRIRVLANNAGLNSARIDFEDSVETVWFSALQEAKNSQKIKRLLDAALDDYPNDIPLQRIARET